MEKQLLDILFRLRSNTMRIIKPGNYNNVKLLSNKYGFDRGKPIDRYYIEKFLEDNKECIRGNCLEIHDNNYTNKYGGLNVIKSDALDIDINNKKATIYGDLQNIHVISNNTYDCIILTHTLGFICDFQKAVKECFRILKIGGTILVTTSGIGPLWNINECYWRFTPKSLKLVFETVFRQPEIELFSYGNMTVCQCFLAGFAVEELEQNILKKHDEHFPLVISLKAKKGVSYL